MFINYKEILAMNKNLMIIVLAVAALLNGSLNAQDFTRITIDNTPGWARGVSWIDYDNDGDLDLFVCNNNFQDPTNNPNKVYRNEGNDSFTLQMPGGFASDTSFSLGQTCADFDNDGDIDFFAANNNSVFERVFGTTTPLGSALFRNEGPNSFSFTRINSGEISGINRFSAFAAAWADYNNDGFVDIFLATPKGAAHAGDTLTNVLFDNNGDGTFTRNLTAPPVNGPKDFYTIPSWSDYDLDGDMDLFITSGPVQDGVLGPDYFYRNLLTETGVDSFVRDTTSNFAADSRDGQQANWIDFDNDGDLDIYITNFGGTPGVTAGMANDFYRNDGGAYTKIIAGPHVTDADVSLGQTWGDFDNDGDLDLYVINLTSVNNFGGNNYYRNDGAPDYTFTAVTTGDFVAGNRAGWGVSSGDYDNDGDLDLYVTYNSLTAGPATDALYRNDLNGGNHWINIRCEGTSSNRSAIGARVRANATVFGNPYWQMREISAQNAATGQNSLRVHFGLGDAILIDSLEIAWPSGSNEIYTNVSVDQFYRAVEGQGLDPLTAVFPPQTAPAEYELYQNYPNPFNPATTIAYTLPEQAEVTLEIVNLLGQKVRTLTDGSRNAGTHETVWDGYNAAGTRAASGVYFYKLEARTLNRKLYSETRKMLLMK